jgi:hypothetical protein
MPDRSYDLHGVRVYEWAADGPPLRNDRDAADLLPLAWQHRATMLVLPAARLGTDFFQLKTRLAGEVIQKLVGYRMRVAIVGDISLHLAESAALRDFVRESNRGNQVWFVESLEKLRAKLEQAMGRPD